VLCHLAPFARLVGAVLAASDKPQRATEVALYGRDLTEAERRMTDLDEINQAFQDEYAHLSFDEAVEFRRDQLATVVLEVERLCDEQLAEKTTYTPSWERPHLYLVIDTFLARCRSRQGIAPACSAP
jgi:hypothetical protein